MVVRHTLVATPIGDLALVVDDDVIVGLYFPDHSPMPSAKQLGPLVGPLSPLFLDASAQLDEYFRKERTTFDLPLQFQGGTQFHRDVWKKLQQIPYGETVTYGDIATSLGGISLARAVGKAVGSNPLSIFVPCHRVIASNGQLTGYAGGTDRKSFLLQLESARYFANEELF
ncbi:cysteine methyltransferase [Boudabousia tangfeifanii]|uniref:Methylated-DNA--protein-cysteine methyltransferase n=1 Tax=Boudabousia tangfeifanii TaxID=1912795 RepID=A0A1D9MJV9_9ACTO|nr:methylated-DNA--[protein]-cysteine S-methyltransferase [Boudabousia tangfeifanii]AOZ72587.1 cysteine methyltransferase [Boudabousia tangfeifanii]